MQSPAFQFYPNDWLSSPKIMLMSPAEEGAYIRLLCYDWANDGIPDDDDQLAVLSRMGEGWFKGGSTTLRGCFIQHPNKSRYLTNPRLQLIRLEQLEHREKSRQGGLQSAKVQREKRLRNQGHFNYPSSPLQPEVNRPVEPNGNPSSSPSSSYRKKAEPHVPSLNEVIEWGKIDGVPAEACERFFHHNEALGWTYQGSEIVNPRSWLKKYWESGARVGGVNKRLVQETPAQAFNRKRTQLELMEKTIAEHPGHPQANFDKPATLVQREEFRDLMLRAKKLRRELIETSDPQSNGGPAEPPTEPKKEP